MCTTDESKACGCDDKTCEHTADPNIEHFNMMPVEDELEWLREQYVVLKQHNDELRRGYSAAGQESATLRRVLASKAPTVRERAAIEIMAQLRLAAQLNLQASSFAEMAVEAVDAADALVVELARERNVGEATQPINGYVS